MKKILLLIIISQSLYALTLSGKKYSSMDPDLGDYIFRETTFTHTTYVSDGENISTIEKEYNYKLVYKDKIPYLCFGNQYENTLLVLANDDLLFLYDRDNALPVFIGTTENPMTLEALTYGRNSGAEKVSSFLVEHDKTYEADNLMNIKLFNPWVEGVSGYGIGQTITIRNLSSVLIFSNGFISYEKPYLYEKNSRLKKIKITDLNSGAVAMIDFADEPSIKEINLTELGLGAEVEIEIVDVYPGTVWADTCVNFIIGW